MASSDSTCEIGVCRAGDSALAYIKTELRSSMSETRLNNLILHFVHEDIKLDYNKVVDIFATRVPRRMLFVDASNHDDDVYTESTIVIFN